MDARQTAPAAVATALVTTTPARRDSSPYGSSKNRQRRAAKRQRKLEREMAAEVAETPITSGIGHKLLLAQGWGGQGLGLREDGITEPVRAEGAQKKRGLLTAEDEELLRATEESVSAGGKRGRNGRELAGSGSAAPGQHVPSGSNGESDTWRAVLEKPLSAAALRAVLEKGGLTVRSLLDIL